MKVMHDFKRYWSETKSWAKPKRKRAITQSKFADDLKIQTWPVCVEYDLNHSVNFEWNWCTASEAINRKAKVWQRRWLRRRRPMCLPCFTDDMKITVLVGYTICGLNGFNILFQPYQEGQVRCVFNAHLNLGPNKLGPSLNLAWILSCSQVLAF